MSTRLCRGGCGKELPETNKNGFAWGHSAGCPSTELPPPNTSVAITEPEADRVIACELSGYQIETIWLSLSLPARAAAVLHALDCER